jgi:hypothetical protein
MTPPETRNGGQYADNHYEKIFSVVRVYGSRHRCSSRDLKPAYRVFKKSVANNSEFHRLASNGNALIDYGNYGEIPNVAGTDYTQINKAPTHININASLNGQAVRQIAICFLPNAVDGVDLQTQVGDTELNLPLICIFIWTIKSTSIPRPVLTSTKPFL